MADGERAGARWVEELTRVIGRQLKHYRERPDRRMSARALSDETDRRGYRGEAQGIANIESGRRRNVPVAELHILARALGIPPALLVAPVGTAETFPVLPEHPAADPWAAYLWLTHDTDNHDVRVLLDTYERHAAAVENVETWIVGLRSTGEPVNDAHTDGWVEALRGVRDVMRARGWVPPRLADPELARLVEAAEQGKEAAP